MGFFGYCVVGVPYILWILTLYQVCALQIVFSHSVVCLFILFISLAYLAPVGSLGERDFLWEVVEQGCSWAIGLLPDQICSQVCFHLACLWRATILGLGHRWGATSSYLDPKALTKALLSADGCQISIFVRDEVWIPAIYRLADVTLWLNVLTFLLISFEQGNMKNFDFMTVVDSHPDCAMY